MTTVAFHPERIREAMRARGMVPDDLALEVRRLSNNQVRATAHQISRWSRGDHEPRASVVGCIAVATGCPLEFFFHLGDEGSPDAGSEGGDEPG